VRESGARCGARFSPRAKPTHACGRESQARPRFNFDRERVVCQSRWTGSPCPEGVVRKSFSLEIAAESRSRSSKDRMHLKPAALELPREIWARVMPARCAKDGKPRFFFFVFFFYRVQSFRAPLNRIFLFVVVLSMPSRPCPTTCRNGILPGRRGVRTIVFRLRSSFRSARQ